MIYFIKAVHSGAIKIGFSNDPKGRLASLQTGSAEPLNCAIAALGHDRIMFSADYPFEKAEEAGHWLDTEKLDEKVRANIAYNNAKRLLKL